MGLFRKNKDSKFKDLTGQSIEENSQVIEQQLPQPTQIQPLVSQPQLPEIQPPQQVPNPYKNLLIELIEHLTKTSEYLISKVNSLG